jgi:guanidinoacetate N-methyltransferase
MTTHKFNKDEDFLSQIPEWETEYKSHDGMIVDYTKDEWKTADALFTESKLVILGCDVMEEWERPYMEVLAKIACQNSGVVLELGYGMGISADFIQQWPINHHMIIEANHSVANQARVFASGRSIKTSILEGLWEDVIESIPDNSLDGILFDTYPLSEAELYQNHFNFFPYAYRKLKVGGVFTYYSDEITSFGNVHIKKLQEAGFQTPYIRSELVNVEPPDDCEYWRSNTILAPIIIKA